MNKQQAFTLIELMIVVAIIGILSSIAYPNYRDYVIRSEDALAKAALAELSVNLEQYYIENNSYKDADTTLPYSKVVPSGGGEKTHDVKLTVTGNGSGYTLEAKHIKETNSIYTLDSTGLKKKGTAIGWEH